MKKILGSIIFTIIYWIMLKLLGFEMTIVAILAQILWHVIPDKFTIQS